MVSVIIATYNYGHFISEAILSVLNQSYADLEIIVADNGSSDDTEQVVSRFNDKRIKYFRIDHSPVSAARNRALEKANGEYILFLDADDKIEENKLASSVALLANDPGTDVVYSDMRYFKDGDTDDLYLNYSCNPHGDLPWMPYVSGSGKTIVVPLLRGNILVISSPVTRYAALYDVGFFDEHLGYNEDWDLWLRLALNGRKFVYADNEGSKALIRVHNSSLSRDVFSMQISGLYVLNKHRHHFKSGEELTVVEQRIKNHRDILKKMLLESDQHLFTQRLERLRTSGTLGALGLPGFKHPKLIRLYLKLISKF